MERGLNSAFTKITVIIHVPDIQVFSVTQNKTLNNLHLGMWITWNLMGVIRCQPKWTLDTLSLEIIWMELDERWSIVAAGQFIRFMQELVWVSRRNRQTDVLRIYNFTLCLLAKFLVNHSTL